MPLPEKLVLPQLFEIIGGKVPELQGVADKAAELAEDVGTSEYALLDDEEPQLSVDELPLKAFDQKVLVSADLSARLKIYDAGTAIALFEPDAELEKLSGTKLGQLDERFAAELIGATMLRAFAGGLQPEGGRAARRIGKSSLENGVSKQLRAQLKAGGASSAKASARARSTTGRKKGSRTSSR